MESGRSCPDIAGLPRFSQEGQSPLRRSRRHGNARSRSAADVTLLGFCGEHSQDSRASGEVRYSSHQPSGPPWCVGGRQTVVDAAHPLPIRLNAALDGAGPLASLPPIGAHRSACLVNWHLRGRSLEAGKGRRSERAALVTLRYFAGMSLHNTKQKEPEHV
jgi:hypothetical protein